MSSKNNKRRVQVSSPQTGIRETNVSAKDLTVLLTEIDQIFGQGASETVSVMKDKKVFTVLFLVPTKTGDLKPIINLRPPKDTLVRLQLKEFLQRFAQLLHLI